MFSVGMKFDSVINKDTCAEKITLNEYEKVANTFYSAEKWQIYILSANLKGRSLVKYLTTNIKQFFKK
jgi:hypothetical protein